MALYTFIFEFDGGTYISQIKARSLKSAVKSWAKKIAKDSPLTLPEKTCRVLTDAIAGDPPTPVSGLANVWCLTALVRGKLALLNIVQTQLE